MGVTGVLLCHTPNKTNATQQLADIGDQIIRLVPHLASRCWFDYKLFRETNSTRFMQYLVLSKFPGKAFCVIGEQEIVVAFDHEFEAILATKLGQYKQRSGLRGEGTVFESDDFRVSVISLTQQSSVKGVAVEVSFHEIHMTKDR